MGEGWRGLLVASLHMVWMQALRGVGDASVGPDRRLPSSNRRLLLLLPKSCCINGRTCSHKGRPNCSCCWQKLLHQCSPAQLRSTSILRPTPLNMQLGTLFVADPDVVLLTSFAVPALAISLIGGWARGLLLLRP